MRYTKKLTAAMIAVSLCVTNFVAFAEVSDKQTIQNYFEAKCSDDRETTEIIVSFSEEISGGNIENIENIIKDGLKTSTDSEIEIGDISKPSKPTTKMDMTLEKVLDKNTVLLKTDDAKTTLKALQDNENVNYAQPNYRLYTATEEPINSKLWAMENKGQIINGTQGNEKADLNIQAAWDITRGSEDVVVAVLDTGIDINHPALAGNIWVNADEQSNGADSDGNGYVDDINGWDFVNDDSSVFDKSEIDEHGTHMAGIIAANGQNGVYGVAPNVKIMPLKVMENDSGYTSDIIEAISYAEANGAKIVNCSFAGLDYNPALADAIGKSDMLFVTSAGNYALSTDDLVAFPACYDIENILSVGASDNTGNVAGLSSFGDLVDVYAPGVGIYSTTPDEGYDFKDGTSCSAAYVTGIAALLYSKYPELTTALAKEALCTKTAYDETAIQLLDNSTVQLDAKAILDFDIINAKSSMPEEIDYGIIATDRQESYPFRFYDEDGVKFSLNTNEISNGSLTVSTIGENENAETIFYTELSDYSQHIVVPNIENDTEYNFLITYTHGTTIHNYYGKLKKDYIEDESKYLTESYNIVTNSYELDNGQAVTLDSTNDGISLMAANNSMNNATEISNDADIYGTISSAGDEHWYKVKFSSNGVANFWLGQVPSNCNYQLQLYNASGKNIAGSYNGNGEQELISFFNVNANTFYYIRIYSASGYSSSQYKFRTKWYPAPDSYESNNTFATATSLSNGTEISANINHPEDVDFYKFTLTGKSYIELKISNIPSGCRYNAEVFKGAGDSCIAGLYTASTSKQYIKILTAGTYYVKVYSYNNASYSASSYKIALNMAPVKTLLLNGNTSGSVNASEMAAYTFSSSSQCGIKIDLTGVSPSDYDLYLYEINSGTFTQAAKGTSSSTTGETVSGTLSSGDYLLVVKRYSGTEKSFTLSSSSTTTAKAAEITLSGFPTTMTHGSSKAVKVTVKNMGYNIWTNSDGYKLSCLNDAPSFTSSEFTLGTSEKVQYGQSRTFSVNLTAPAVSAAKDYTLSFRMKQNSSLFGTASESVVIKVLPESETISVGNTKTISGVSEKYYKLTVSSAANYVFRTMKYNTNCDTELYLYDSNMNQLTKNDDIYDGNVCSSNYYSKIERYLNSGTYYIRVKKHSGGSVQCYLNVDTYTEQNITSSVNVSNKYEGYYKYTVSTAGKYVFSTKRYSRNCDTYLILLDVNGNVVATNNDSGTVYAKIETELSKGTYYIRVSSNNYIVKGEDAKTYCTLTVGLQSTAPSTSESASISISTPSASGVIKTYNGNSIKISGSASNCSSVTVKVGSKTLSNVKLNGSKYEAYYKPTESGTYTITVTGKAVWGTNPSATRSVKIAVNDDSDNFTSSPTAINSGTERTAAIDYAGDVDCFSFTPKETGSYKIYSSGSVDLKGVLYENDKVTSIGTSYNAPESINFKLAKTLEKNKTYYIKVDAETSGATGKYSLIIEKIDEPNDTHLSKQWGILNIGQSYTITDSAGNSKHIVGKVGSDINVLPVWEYTKGKGIKVGIVDTGTDISHNDLTGNISPTMPGYNFVYDSGSPLYVSDAHGTHVSGIAGAVGDNSLGVSGVAPECQIVTMPILEMPFDATKPKNNDIDTAFIDAINYAVDNDINILNCSFEMWDYPESSMIELKKTIINASNILFVCAAGNRSLNLTNNKKYYPVGFDTDNMIVVAAINSDGKFADTYSNYGGPTDVAAPGTAVYSTIPGGQYDYMTGTSMAAPHVSGTAALLMSYYPDLSVAEIKQRIISSNNVSYNETLNGKVASNGVLNAWYALCNDAPAPRKSPRTETALNVKNDILEHMNKADDTQLTGKLYLNILDGYNLSDIESAIGGSLTVIKENKLTGSLLIDCGSVSAARDLTFRLNASEFVDYAEPVYKVFAAITKAE